MTLCFARSCKSSFSDKPSAWPHFAAPPYASNVAKAQERPYTCRIAATSCDGDMFRPSWGLDVDSQRDNSASHSTRLRSSDLQVAMIGECIESRTGGTAITRSRRKVRVAVVDGHDGREWNEGYVDNELTAVEGNL